MTEGGFASQRMSPLQTATASVLLFLPIAVLFVRAPLTKSFWLDECVTGWVIADGAKLAIERAIEFQGQSPLYFLLVWLTSTLFGNSELILRAPSVFCIILAAIFVGALGQRYFGLLGGMLSGTLFLLHDGVARAAFSARPYALAILATVVAAYSLERFISQRRGIFGWFVLAALVVAFYAHYLFVLILPVLVVRLAMEREWRLPGGLVGLALTALLLVPGGFQLFSLFNRRQSLFFSSSPDVLALLRAIVPIPLAVYLGMSAVIVAIFLFPRVFDRVERPGVPWRFFIAWAVFAPGVFFLQAVLADGKFFVDRYYVWQAPGVALLGAGLLSAPRQLKARLIAVTAVSGLALFFELGRRWQIEDWRGAAETLRREKADHVVLYSGLIEAEQTEWLSDPGKTAYLSAPFRYYSIESSRVLVVGSKLGSVEVARIRDARVGPRSVWFASNQILQRPRALGEDAYVHQNLLRALQSVGTSEAREVSLGANQLVHLFELPLFELNGPEKELR